jgi:hypothetical protein
MVLFKGRSQLTATIVEGRYIRPIIVKILTAAASFVLCSYITVKLSYKSSPKRLLTAKDNIDLLSFRDCSTTSFVCTDISLDFSAMSLSWPASS